MLTYLLTAIGLTSGGSSTVHISTQTVHRTTQLIWEECGPCTFFASYTLAFATTEVKARNILSHGSRRMPVGTMKINIQNKIYITIRIHKHKNKNI